MANVVLEVGDKIEGVQGGKALYVWRVTEGYEEDSQQVEAETAAELARIANRATLAAEEAEKNARRFERILHRVSELVGEPSNREDALIAKLKERLGIKPPEPRRTSPAFDLAGQLRELTNQAFERARCANNPNATAVYLRLREQCRREAITL